MRFSTPFTILLLSLLGNTPVFANEKAIWACRTSNPNGEPIVHLVEWGRRSYIKFSYLRIAAHYETGDDYQAWYWHNDGSGYYRYGLILGTDNRAWYHDFARASGAEESTPLDYFVCNFNEND